MFEAIGSREQEYSLQSNRTCFALGNHVVVLRDVWKIVVALEAVEHNDEVDDNP